MRVTDIPEDQLKEVLEKMIDKVITELAKKNPNLLKLSDEDKSDLAQNIVNTMKNGQSPMSLTEMSKPEFIHELSVNLVAALTLKPDEKKDLLKTLRDLFSEKGLDPKKLNPKDLKKLTEDDLNKIQLEIKNCYKEIMNELEKTGLIIKPPSPHPEKENPKDPNSKDFFNFGKDDENTNLFGLMCVWMTGSAATVVQVLIGIGNAQEQGPVIESAEDQISLPNRISDTRFGDSLGLNAEARERYQAENASLIDEAQQPIQEYIHRKQLHPHLPGT